MTSRDRSVTSVASSPLSSDASSARPPASSSGVGAACSEGGAGSLLHPSVTPEMKDAGAEIISAFSEIYPPDELAALVFRAMLRLAHHAQHSVAE